MARNPRWDTEKLSSHAPRPRAREPGASATTGRVEGSRTAAAADGDGPNLLDFPIEAVDELATFAAGSAAGDGGGLAPAGISALLGVEESAPIRSAHDQYRAPRSDSADELRQSSGCAEDPRRVAEARFDGLASDGFEVHDPPSAAAVAGVAHVFEESRDGLNRVGFVHGSHRDLSGVVRARDPDPQPAPAGSFQYHLASDCGMDGTPTARGVRAGGGAPVPDSGSRPSLWRTIFAPGQGIGHPRSGNCAPLALAKRVRRAGDWLDSSGMPRPRSRDRRAASSPDPVEVRRLLQRDADTLVIG